MKVRIATRGSRLALVQTAIVVSLLKEKGVETEVVTVSTKGDKDQKSALCQIGGQGLFVKEIEQYLLSGRADIAVHSGKDLPYTLAEGLVIAATPPAGPSCDVLISRKDAATPARIGTGSPRRFAECSRLFPQAQFLDIRGNVDTRLAKLRGGDYDAVVLAQAGLERLGADLGGFNVRVLSPAECIPAPCQGIIAVECRESDTALIQLLKECSHTETFLRFTAERYLFGLLNADCSVPIGIYSQLSPDGITLTALFGGRKGTSTAPDYKTAAHTLLAQLEVK